jgi:hypothetical protein
VRETEERERKRLQRERSHRSGKSASARIGAGADPFDPFDSMRLPFELRALDGLLTEVSRSLSLSPTALSNGSL